MRRSKLLRPKGIHYLDAGTSGGVWGFERGYCLMIGGDKEAVERLDPNFFHAGAVARPIFRQRTGRDPKKGTSTRGYLHGGPPGAGHFVKMIHNGIEYGMMQAYAEGFEIMRGCNAREIPEDRRYDLNLADIAEVWRRGSVVSSWLLDLTATALAKG